MTRQGKIISEVIVLGKKRGNEVTKIIKYNYIKYKGCVLSIKTPDNIIVLKNEQIIKINKILQLEAIIIIQGAVWNKKAAIFEVPINSCGLNMWELEGKESTFNVSVSLDEICSKMCKFQLNFSLGGEMRVFVIPLLHD